MKSLTVFLGYAFLVALGTFVALEMVYPRWSLWWRIAFSIVAGAVIAYEWRGFDIQRGY